MHNEVIQLDRYVAFIPAKLGNLWRNKLSWFFKMYFLHILAYFWKGFWENKVITWWQIYHCFNVWLYQFLCSILLFKLIEKKPLSMFSHWLYIPYSNINKSSDSSSTNILLFGYQLNRLILTSCEIDFFLIERIFLNNSLMIWKECNNRNAVNVLGKIDVYCHIVIRDDKIGAQNNFRFLLNLKFERNRIAIT